MKSLLAGASGVHAFPCHCCSAGPLRVSHPLWCVLKAHYGWIITQRSFSSPLSVAPGPAPPLPRVPQDRARPGAPCWRSPVRAVAGSAKAHHRPTERPALRVWQSRDGKCGGRGDREVEEIVHVSWRQATHSGEQADISCRCFASGSWGVAASHLLPLMSLRGLLSVLARLAVDRDWQAAVSSCTSPSCDAQAGVKHGQRELRGLP